MPLNAKPSDHPNFPPHGRTGLLLVNLGTPEGTDKKNMRKYLKQFLSDPHEMRNLAGAPAKSAMLEEILAEARATWDGAALKERIIKDQNRRRLIGRAHRAGTQPTWDFQPMTDASRQFVRAGDWTAQVEADGHLDVT